MKLPRTWLLALYMGQAAAKWLLPDPVVAFLCLYQGSSSEGSLPYVPFAHQLGQMLHGHPKG